MVRTIYFSCDFIYTAVKIWGTLQLMKMISRPKWGRRIHYAIWAAVIIVVAGLNTYNNSISVTLFSNNVMMAIILLLSLVSVATYGCRYRDSFCINLLLWTGLALVDFFFLTMSYAALAALEAETDIFLTATFCRGVYLLLSAIFLWAAMRYVWAWIKRKGCDIGIYLKWGWFLVLPFLVCMVYFQRIYKLLISEQVIRRWWLFLAGSILMVFLFLGYLIVQKEKGHSRLLKLRMDIMECDYKELLRVYEEKEILLHDVKRHMLAIRGMVEKGQKQEIFDYLDEMNEVLQKGRNRNLVNHDLVNLILNQKFQEAENANITLKYEMVDMYGLTLKSTEICALFSNILDNAIGANRKIAEDIERWIQLRCTRKGRILIIFVSNPMVEKEVRVTGGIPETTKQDKKRHGFGMRSIRQIVNMHDGHMLIESKNNVFQLTVCLQGF